jgi:signal transduction histidine kinase
MTRLGARMEKVTLANSLRILLVEDSASDIALIEAALAQSGFIHYSLHKTRLLREAIHLLETEAFDVVLLDFTLPDTIGFNGLLSLQSVAPSLPIIMVTGPVSGVAEEEMALSAVECGAQDWLLKSNINSQSIKRAMQYAVQRKQLENMKNEFISMVSHELRTPLTSIRGALGLVVGTMADALPEKVRRLITIAHSNSERLIVLINDILDIDKIASGHMRLEMQPESILALTQQAVDATHGYATKYDVSVEIIAEEGDFVANLDGARFIQILSNLLSNAAKFSPAHSVVTVRVESCGDQVRVAVKDCGSGISDEFRERIFGRFVQADSSLTRRKGGSGLGLHISKALVEHMGGTIGFDSPPGEGATFWVEFPMMGENADDA